VFTIIELVITHLFSIFSFSIYKIQTSQQIQNLLQSPLLFFFCGFAAKGKEQQLFYVASPKLQSKER